MKPTMTYLALLTTAAAATAVTYHLGMDNQAIATGIAGTLNLLAFQGRTQFHRPYWADGIEIQPPETSHIASVAVIVDAAAIGIGLASGSALVGIIARTVGLFIQAAAVGKLLRDHEGGDAMDRIAGSIQDNNHSPKQPHP